MTGKLRFVAVLALGLSGSLLVGTERRGQGSVVLFAHDLPMWTTAS